MNRRIEIPQTLETDISQVERPVWKYCYGYSRSYESRDTEDIGQDYLTFAEEEGTLLFAICDGVGMSYEGDFAAKFIGDHLINWLDSLDNSDADSVLYADALNQLLKGVCKEAIEHLNNRRVPETVNWLLQEVLASKKKLGSSTVYGCGRIDLPSKSFPLGRIILAWQGDIRIRLWSAGIELEDELGDRFRTSHQWNSSHGPVGGPPYVWCNNLYGVGSVGSLLMYSDGLRALDCLTNHHITQFRTILSRESFHPSSDDMSLFHIDWNLNRMGESTAWDF